MMERAEQETMSTEEDEGEDSAKLLIMTSDDQHHHANAVESSSSSRIVKKMERRQRALAFVIAISVAACFVIVLSFYPSGTSLRKHNAGSKTCSAIISSREEWEALVYKSALAPQKDRCWRPGHRYDLPCFCKSALEPYPYNSTKPGLGERWNTAFQRNLDLVATHKKNDTSLDVVLLGDSMTEHWLGTDAGHPRKIFAGNHQVYQDLFSSADAPLKGVALGIGGDRIPNLVYRLLHGEGELSSAKVYWLLIGVNDHLGEESCSSDMIVAGNIHTVQLLRALAPNATIVVNSLLPFGGGNLTENRGWLFLHEVNEKLACYASSVPNVEFFNATSLFLVNNDVHAQQVNMSLYSGDHFHPGAKGSEIWGNAIVKKVEDLIQK